jgi:serine/threonine-protein kinase RIM15
MEEPRIEASIAEINESIAELRNTVRELKAALDTPAANAAPENCWLSPSSSLTQLFKLPLSTRLQKASVRKLQHKLLSQIEEILQTSQDISMPGLREDQSP